MASIIHSVRFQSSSYLFLCDLDQTCKPLHPTCISEPWMPMTLILVHCLSIHRTFLVGTNHWYCILGTAHKTCYFGDALIQLSSHHFWPLFGSLRFIHFPIFLASNVWDSRTDCSLAPWCIPSLDRCHWYEIINVGSSFIVFADQCELNVQP